MIFYTTLSQMAFLFLLIAIGYLLAKRKLVPEHAEQVLSRLENDLFIPALVTGTFLNHFTVEKLSGARDLLLGSIVLELILIPVSMVCVRLCTKDRYLRNIYLYGLCFSNFGFMGNAVVSALFPDIFPEYIIFTLVLWTGIYVWGAPTLLMGNGQGRSWKDRLKSFFNPMFLGMFLGMVVGLAGIPLPGFLRDLVETLGDCMSPIAMLLTGMTMARSRLGEILRVKSIYVVTFLRLVVFPLVFLAAASVLPLSRTYVICAVCSLTMPLGLNTIVIPAAYGKDTRVASGMAVVSHLFSCITIPLIFMLLNRVIGN